VRIALPPGGQDPADSIRERGLQQLVEQVDRAPDALEFALQIVKGKYDLDSATERLEGLEEVLSMIAALRMTTSSEQQLRLRMVIMEISSTFGGDEETLLARIDELRRRRPRAASAVVANTESTESAGPMDRRERQIVTWLVTQPGRSAQRLQDLFPAAEVKHPMLRRLVEAVYRIYQEKGVLASCDALRESLNDPGLDAWIMQAQAEVPDDEAHERGLADIAAALIMDRRRAEIAAAKRRSTE